MYRAGNLQEPSEPKTLEAWALKVEGVPQIHWISSDTDDVIGRGSYRRGAILARILARRQDCHVMASGCGRPVARLKRSPHSVVHTLQLETGRFNESLKVLQAFLVRL